VTIATIIPALPGFSIASHIEKQLVRRELWPVVVAWGGFAPKLPASKLAATDDESGDDERGGSAA